MLINCGLCFLENVVKFLVKLYECICFFNNICLCFNVVFFDLFKVWLVIFFIWWSVIGFFEVILSVSFCVLFCSLLLFVIMLIKLYVFIFCVDKVLLVNNKYLVILWGIIWGNKVVFLVLGYMLKFVWVLLMIVFLVVIIIFVYIVVFRLFVIVILFNVVIIGFGKLCSGLNMFLYNWFKKFFFLGGSFCDVNIFFKFVFV